MNKERSSRVPPPEEVGLGLLFHPWGAKNLNRVVGHPLLGRGIEVVKRMPRGPGGRQKKNGRRL
jgi:hypothetical protein